SKALKIVDKGTEIGNDVLSISNKLTESPIIKGKKMKATLDTVGKVVNTGEEAIKTSGVLKDKGLEFFRKIKTTPKKGKTFNEKIGRAGVTEGKKKVYELKKSLNEVNDFFNTSKEYLDKTNTVSKHFENILSKSSGIQKKEKKQEKELSLNSLNKIFTNKEEITKGFELTKDTFFSIRKIKREVDEWPGKKTVKSKNNRFSI
ncbi:hypothetical protein OAT18_03340, partial [Tenacibaculum sp.]|nr:hypothetical protein [Tenacibaculum sp.]